VGYINRSTNNHKCSATTIRNRRLILPFGGFAVHLVYLDETGNTGTDLNDTQQPIFLLGALVVPEAHCQSLESDLNHAIEQHFPLIAEDGLEIHAADLRAGRGYFKKATVDARLALRNESENR